MEITAQEHLNILKLPQHDADGTANAEWLAARRWRFTGSMIGAICGMNPHESQDDAVSKKLAGASLPRMPALQWGNDHEDFAERAFEECVLSQYTDARLEHMGLYVSPEYPCLGMSPDGILVRNEGGVEIRELVEYKCPYTWKKKTGTSTIYPFSTWGKHTYPIPSYYLAQIMYGMRLLDLPRAHFVVWAPLEDTDWEFYGDGVTSASASYKIAHTVVEYDPELGEHLVNESVRVWNERIRPTYEQHKAAAERRSGRDGRI